VCVCVCVCVRALLLFSLDATCQIPHLTPRYLCDKYMKSGTMTMEELMAQLNQDLDEGARRHYDSVFAVIFVMQVK